MQKYQLLISKKLEDGSIQLRGHYYDSPKELKLSAKHYTNLFSNSPDVTVSVYKHTKENIWDELDINKYL